MRGGNVTWRAAANRRGSGVPSGAVDATLADRAPGGCGSGYPSWSGVVDAFRSRCDVLVIGAGGGSTAATMLARKGGRCSC